VTIYVHEKTEENANEEERTGVEAGPEHRLHEKPH
jgi:hypothetical protein